MIKKGGLLSYILIITIISIMILPTTTISKTVKNSYTENEKEYYALIGGGPFLENTTTNIFIDIIYSEKQNRYVYDSLLKSKNWKEENIILLTEEQATKDNVTNALINLSKKVDENDVFFFSWHSHGNRVLDDDGDESIYDESDIYDEVILPYDGKIIDKDHVLNYITDDELAEYLTMFNCESVIVSIECCFSGGFGDDISYAFEKENKSVFIMLSTDEDCFEWFHPRLNWGWDAFLADSLSSSYSDKNNDGWVSAEEAFENAAPTYFFRTYFSRHSSIFLMGSIGFNKILKFFELTNMKRILLSGFLSLILVRIVEMRDYKILGANAMNRAHCYDQYDGELLITKL